MSCQPDSFILAMNSRYNGDKSTFMRKVILTGQQPHSGLRQAELVMALSLATDPGTGRPMEWAMRSALPGVRLGEAPGSGQQELREVYYCALLAYIGCTSEIGLAIQIFGDDPATTLASVDLIDKGSPRQRYPGCSDSGTGRTRLVTDRCRFFYPGRPRDFGGGFRRLGCGGVYFPG